MAAAEAWARGHRAAWPPETIDSKPVQRAAVGAAEMRRLELELLAAVEGR